MTIHPPTTAAVRVLALAALLATAAAPARAGLFDDEEARKAIVELRTRVQAGDDAQRARQAAAERALAQAGAQAAQANAQLAEQVQQLRRAVLDLTERLEALRAEQARLRGSDEQILRTLADVQRAQLDAQAQLGAERAAAQERARAAEPQKVSVDGREFVAEPNERRAYDAAIAPLRAGDFERAAAALAAFVAKYPGSGYAEPARFWLGNAQYGMRAYKESIATLRQFVAAAPDHPRAPEAMLAIANGQLESKDRAGARRTLDELIKAHPSSEAAQAARERLASLKG